MANENNKYSKLFEYVELLRLKEDKVKIDHKLEATKHVEVFGSSWDKFKAGFKNTYNKVVASAGNYDNKNSNITNELSRFEKENSVVSESEAKELLLELNNSDETGLATLMFDINTVLDNKYHYTYLSDGLEAASIFLHDDVSRLTNLRNELERTYKIIADKSLSNVQKGILAGAAIATIAACIIVPIATPGAIAGTAALSTLAIGSTLTGGAYIAMKEYNKEQVKKQFREYTADELAMQLSIQILCISHLKNKLKEEDFKDKLNVILSELNNLKADLDYYLFVERHETSKNKPKLSVFYGFDRCLVDILGV